MLVGGLALIIAAEAFFLLFWRYRSWQPLRVNRASLHFPDICPACFATPASKGVMEASFSRQSGVTQKEFLTLDIPYCQACGEQIIENRKVGMKFGWMLAALTIAISYFLFGIQNEEQSGQIASIIGFGFVLGWPFYSLVGHRQQAVTVRRYNKQVIDFRIKHSRYFEAFKLQNSIT
jgi:hypothetical protein